VMALEACGEVESIHKAVCQKDGKEVALEERLAEPFCQVEQILDKMLIQQLLEELNKEERQLIYLRYFANRTQGEVGKMLGISQVQVSRLEKRILNRLRQKMDVY